MPAVGADGNDTLVNVFHVRAAAAGGDASLFERYPASCSSQIGGSDNLAMYRQLERSGFQPGRLPHLSKLLASALPTFNDLTEGSADLAP